MSFKLESFIGRLDILQPELSTASRPISASSFENVFTLVSMMLIFILFYFIFFNLPVSSGTP